MYQKSYWSMALGCLLMASCSQMHLSQRAPSASEEEERYELADCYRDICVGNEVFNSGIGKVNESHGIIKEIQLHRWALFGGEGIIVPYAKVQMITGEMKERVDVRYLVKYPLKPMCTNMGTQNFCPNDDVVIMPRDSWGDQRIYPTKVFAIIPPGIDGADRVLTLDPTDKGKYTQGSPMGIGKKGECFSKDHPLCIGESYDNGLGSKDKILAYFPLNDYFVIQAGDINSQRSVFRKEIIARITGQYRVEKKYKGNTYDHASISGSKNEKVASDQVIAKAKQSCGYEFLGQGILDPESNEKPTVKNCDRKLNGPGIGHGIHGPSWMVTCEVSFNYTCVHKKSVK